MRCAACVALWLAFVAFTAPSGLALSFALVMAGIATVCALFAE